MPSGDETLLAALKAEEAQQWEQAYGLYAEAKLRLGVQLAQERLPATCEAYRRKISVCLERRAAIRSKGCLPLGQVRTSQTSEIGSEPDTPASPRTPGTPQTPRRESSGHIALAAARAQLSEAVRLDEAGHSAEAVVLYASGVELLLACIKQDESEEIRTRLKAQAQSYVSRAEQLRAAAAAR